MTIEIGKSNVPATEIKTVKTGKDITIKKSQRSQRIREPVIGL